MPKIQANGVELYYELHGAEDAPLLVLNNGILMNAAGSWVFQTQALAKHYRVLQYDCRGQGQSEHPGEAYTMELHADDLAALLTALGYEGAHIAGISYGGEVGQTFVLKYPGALRVTASLPNLRSSPPAQWFLPAENSHKLRKEFAQQKGYL